MRLILVFAAAFSFAPFALRAQDFIFTKEGKPIMNRRIMINDCLQALKKDKTDPVAVQICECQVNVIDRNVTQSQYKKFTKNKTIDLSSIIDADSSLSQQMEDCYKSSGKSVLMSVERSSDEYIRRCMASITSSSAKSLDSQKVKSFCACQYELITSKKVSDEEYKTLADPNSMFFFEVMYKCGSPYTVKGDEVRNWTPTAANDVNGPASDTVSVLTINGMSYVKMKIGSHVWVWMLDSGASDILITNEMEALLKQEKVLTEQNYLGINEYEMANGQVDTCRNYRINSLRIGKYTINDITISVSDKARRILVGRTLLNKFSKWMLFNDRDILVLVK